MVEPVAAMRRGAPHPLRGRGDCNGDLTAATPGLKAGRWSLVMLIAALALAGACNTEQPLPTLMVLYVTATPEPSDTPEPTLPPSPVVPTVALPTIEPSTATPTPPPPTLPPTLTPSFTPTFTETPGPSPAPGVVAGSGQNPGACTGGPGGGFAAIYNSDPTLAAALGCAVGAPIAITSAVQDFETGRMVWASQLGEVPQRVIYAVYNNGTYQRFDDTWNEGIDPVAAPGSEGAPPGRSAPIRGFGKVWASNQAVRNALQWALSGEAGAPAQIQRFQRGEMLYISSLNQTYVFANGAWRLDPRAY